MSLRHLIFKVMVVAVFVTAVATTHVLPATANFNATAQVHMMITIHIPETAPSGTVPGLNVTDPLVPLVIAPPEVQSPAGDPPKQADPPVVIQPTTPDPPASDPPAQTDPPISPPVQSDPPVVLPADPPVIQPTLPEPPVVTDPQSDTQDSTTTTDQEGTTSEEASESTD